MAKIKPIEPSLVDIEVNKIFNMYETLGPLRRFFFPKKISEAIDNKKSSTEISTALFNHTWYIHTLLFPELANFKLTHEPYTNLEDRVQRVSDSYKAMRPFRQFFFPRAFKALMSNETNPSALQIAQALHAGTSFYHKLLFPSILGGYFTSRNIESTRWLFDPNVIPSTEVGKAIEGDLAKIESLSTDPTPFDNIKNYYQKHTYVKYFISTELRELLKSKDVSEPNEKLRITLAVDNLPWYSKLLVNFLYPSMLRRFKDRTDTFLTQIKAKTMIGGNERVERNLKTLNELRTHTQFSKTLDNDLANLLSSLNHTGELSRNVHAQKALDLIRIFSLDNPTDTPYLCDALTLYFKNYTDGHGNKRLRALVDSFKKSNGLLQLYKFLRDRKLDLFSPNTPQQNRSNFDAIEKINNPTGALVAFEILNQHGILTQENFITFIEFEKNKSNQLDQFNDKLKHLTDAITSLNPTLKIDQRLYDAFMIGSSNGTTNSLIERFTRILTLMNDAGEKKDTGYDLFLQALACRRTLSSSEFSAYLTSLEDAMHQLNNNHQLTIENVNALLASSATNPTQIKDDILARLSSPQVDEQTVIDILPPPSELDHETRLEQEATTLNALLGGFIRSFIPQPRRAEPHEEDRRDEPQIDEPASNTPEANEHQVSPSSAVSYAPALAFPAAYVATNLASSAWTFVAGNMLPFSMATGATLVTLGYVNRGLIASTTSNYATRVKQQLTDTLIPSSSQDPTPPAETAPQQVMTYTLPALCFPAAYAGTNAASYALPWAYSFINGRTLPISVAGMVTLCAFGYTNRAPISAAISDFAGQTSRRIRETASGYVNPLYSGRRNPTPAQVEEVHDDEQLEQRDEARGGPHQEVPVQSQQEVSFMGLSLPSLNQCAWYAGALFGTAGGIYALYQDPAKTTVLAAITYLATNNITTARISSLKETFFTSSSNRAPSQNGQADGPNPSPN